MTKKSYNSQQNNVPNKNPTPSKTPLNLSLSHSLSRALSHSLSPVAFLNQPQLPSPASQPYAMAEALCDGCGGDAWAKKKKTDRALFHGPLLYGDLLFSCASHFQSRQPPLLSPLSSPRLTIG